MNYNDRNKWRATLTFTTRGTKVPREILIPKISFIQLITELKVISIQLRTIWIFFSKCPVA